MPGAAHGAFQGLDVVGLLSRLPCTPLDAVELLSRLPCTPCCCSTHAVVGAFPSVTACPSVLRCGCDWDSRCDMGPAGHSCGDSSRRTLTVPQGPQGVGQVGQGTGWTVLGTGRDRGGPSLGPGGTEWTVLGSVVTGWTVLGSEEAAWVLAWSLLEVDRRSSPGSWHGASWRCPGGAAGRQGLGSAGSADLERGHRP